MKPNLKIALSGARGFIGRELTDFWSNDSSVTVHPLRGELDDADGVREWLTGCDVVVHLAERGHPTEAYPEAEAHAAANLRIGARLAEAMKAEGVKRLIYASSGGALYRGVPAGTIDEGSPVTMRTPYSMTKFLLEKRFLDLAVEADWHVSILRISNPYGVHQIGRTQQGIIGAAIEKLFRNEPLPLWTSLGTAKDFLSAHDLCLAFQHAVRKPVSGIFNIGSGRATTLGELFATLEKVSGRKLKVKRQPMPVREAERIALDCGKAKRAWGWSPAIGLEEGIAKLWRHRLSDKIKRVA